MKWFGLKIGLKLKINEFSSIGRFFFLGLWSRELKFWMSNPFLFLAVFSLLQRMIHFSVCAWNEEKWPKPPAWPYWTFVWFSTERTSCRWKRAKHNRSGPFVEVCVSFAVASLRHFTKMSHVFHKDIFFWNLFPEVVLRKSIFLSREFSRYSKGCRSSFLFLWGVSVIKNASHM